MVVKVVLINSELPVSVSCISRVGSALLFSWRENTHFSGFHSTRLNRRGDHDDDYGDGLGFRKSQVFYYFWLNL